MISRFSYTVVESFNDTLNLVPTLGMAWYGAVHVSCVVWLPLSQEVVCYFSHFLVCVSHPRREKNL